RWDGVAATGMDIEGMLKPSQIREIGAFVKSLRTHPDSFDLVVSGFTGDDDAADSAMLREYKEAGATWWIEAILPWKRSLEQARARIRKGPPATGTLIFGGRNLETIPHES